jgi:hypothetical protein
VDKKIIGIKLCSIRQTFKPSKHKIKKIDNQSIPHLIDKTHYYVAIISQLIYAFLLLFVYHDSN